MDRIERIADTFSKLQQEICQQLEEADGKGNFNHNSWEKNLGNGVTSVLENGEVIEKGAVNFSFVKGDFSERMERILGEKGTKYAATGISSILHPENPWMPIIHMNVRYFTLDSGVSWFGGGIDLTPHIIVPREAAKFHQSLKEACDTFDNQFYPDFKQWADDYFYLTHRKETRGVGGIFFDRQRPGNPEEQERLFGFCVALAKKYPEIYIEFMNKNGRKKYTEREKKWQQLRRGRYVEFNLIHDRGTKFGLESGGNTESILVSMPANAGWAYNYQPEAGGFEAETLSLLKKGIDWINFKADSQ
ncbi:coproporphyrinogen oxidase [Tangfeifania diversioriginum]|uniref:coproporphyrinogen oxidase n=1 Tax=Tangfeifania diversioriginum TaxID=1168035 RepID=A0A1M6F9C8_9BACT|nr:oxygen-dependent coproporphyrinogen oxidase [Tangfeifania diversioriginum]SHI94285.1 coproporphyrinogen oxidase [Tangfeifania diversioriginum]